MSVLVGGRGTDSLATMRYYTFSKSVVSDTCFTRQKTWGLSVACTYIYRHWMSLRRETKVLHGSRRSCKGWQAPIVHISYQQINSAEAPNAHGECLYMSTSSNARRSQLQSEPSLATTDDEYDLDCTLHRHI